MNESKYIFPEETFLKLNEENQNLVIDLMNALKVEEDEEVKMISTDQAADMMSMTRQNILNLLNSGKLKGVRISPRKVLIRKSSVEKLLNKK